MTTSVSGRTALQTLITRHWLVIALLSVSAPVGSLLLNFASRDSLECVQHLELGAQEVALVEKAALLAQLLPTRETSEDRDGVVVELRAVRQLMEQTHERIFHGDSQAPRFLPESVRRIFDEAPYKLDAHLHHYFSLVQTVCASPDARLEADDPLLVEILELGAGRLPDGLERAVAERRVLAIDTIGRHQTIAALVLATLAAALVIAALAIFQPAARRVRKAIEDLEMLNVGLEEESRPRLAQAQEAAVDQPA